MPKQKRNNHDKCISVTRSDSDVGASALLLAAHGQPLSPEEVAS